MQKRIELSDFKFRISRPVEWSDMDAARHVNNLVYLRWAETSRIAYFEQAGMDTSFASDLGMILGWQDCKYIFPMTYPDTAVIGVRTIELADQHFSLQTGVFSEQHERLAAVCHQRIVPYDYLRLTRVGLPTSWREGISRLEADDQPPALPEEPD
ncbi:MAG: acyl-CoA thioesterase [Bacteroidota bacterium]